MSSTLNSQEFQKALESILDAHGEHTENSVPENNFQKPVSGYPVASSSAQKSGKPAALPPRRPTTRSQTGTIAKRRTRDDGHVEETRKRALPPRKRQKVTAHSFITLDSSSSHTQESASPMPPPTREASLSSTSSTGVQSSIQPQPAFYHSSISESDQPPNRLPRSRASLPTPIPNLTKKSRGRRVPTKDLTSADSNQKDNRLYVCTVEGCGKCFHRGEHLKRHIRSIHTHEKPFKCTFPLCEKYFNRHDNLLQHLKVHRQSNTDPDDQPPVEKISFQMEMGMEDVYFVEPVSAPPQHGRDSHPRHRSYSPAEEDPMSPVSPPARPRTIYDAFPLRYGPFAPSATSGPMMYNHSNLLEGNATEKFEVPIGCPTGHETISSNEAMSILSNVAASTLRMEVSSLRTELPQSPVDMRTNMGVVQMG